MSPVFSPVERKTDNINTRSIKHGISDIYDNEASNG